MTECIETITASKIEPKEALGYFLKPRDPEADKFANGRVLVIAGSSGMTGAAVLCARGAMRSGAGLVYSALPAECMRSVEPVLLEAVNCPVGRSGKTHFDGADVIRMIELSAGMDAVVIGPGLGREDGTKEFVRTLLSSREFAPDAGAVIIDADGLYPYSGDPGALEKAAGVRPGKIVITPHEGEASRLLGICREHIGASREKSALKLASLLSGGTAVLKGHRTLVATRNELSVNVTGNPGMGTGGSGDVLAGIIAGMTAGHGKDCQQLKNIVEFAVAVHGCAGDVMAEKHSQRFITASDIITGLGELTEYA